MLDVEAWTHNLRAWEVDIAQEGGEGLPGAS